MQYIINDMNKFFIILLASISLISCSNKNHEKSMTIRKNNFTWNVQLAGYDYNRYDEKGQIDYENFIIEFDKFPWIEQIESFQKIQKGCSATLSVKDDENKTSFWVSIMGDVNNNSFLVGYVYPKIKKGLFGLGKEKQISWLEIFIAKDSEQVKKCFRLYFSNELDALQLELKTMEKYGEMEAQN
jgi:hypothetical protein